MKKLMGLVLILVLASSSAFAQAEKYDAGIFFDAAGTMSATTVAPFTPFNIYAMGFDLDGEVKGYEFGAAIDPRLTILSSTPNPPTALNLGLAPANWIVGTGACLTDTPGEWFVMVTWSGMVLDGTATDLTLCITASDPSSFVPAVPGYLQCDATLIPFGVAQNGGGFYPDGCGVVNNTMQEPVGITEASWGAVKAQY